MTRSWRHLPGGTSCWRRAYMARSSTRLRAPLGDRPAAVRRSCLIIERLDVFRARNIVGGARGRPDVRVENESVNWRNAVGRSLEVAFYEARV